MDKKIIVGSLMVIGIILFLSIASAEFWACFNKGEKIDYCNPKTKDRTAPNDGYQLCMSNYNETRQCYNQGNWQVCNTLPPECSNMKGNTSLDAESPNLTINSPEQNGLYTEKYVLLDLELDEEGSIYYKDNLNGNNNWKRLCSDCSEYHRTKSFNEGKNNITFKAVDVMDNVIEVERNFFIDSKKPKIKRTEPRNGFIASPFEVEIQEENPSSLVLHYGNPIEGYREENINLSDCESIKGNSDKFYCSTEVNLSDYNGQGIVYWFELEDIVGNKDESKPISLKVDTTPPMLNNPASFWEQGTGIQKKYIYFNFNITEENFDSVEYYDYEESKPRWRKLCSRLKNGICEKKVSFRKGEHVLDVQITDKAGNAVSERIEFEVV